MEVIIYITVGLVALLHFFFLILEMFLWTKPYGMKTFGLSKEQATETAALAANQGLYNGFLSAGLIWGLSLGVAGTNIIIFFLVCVIFAGIFGALTAKYTIIFVQALPAAIALALILLL